ncbi:hypothetical protein [Caudoviricetes sp.]|nr:hypothetical protein [Caudoviricetes sp.]
MLGAAVGKFGSKHHVINRHVVSSIIAIVYSTSATPPLRIQ